MASRIKLSRLRVTFQVLLHVLLAGHVIAWYLLDWKALGALDFQAFFHYFLGHGLVTAGGILAIAAFGLALIFGRLFCSWGCHFAGMQDLAAWILKRLGWKPPLVHARILHFAPFLVLLVVFILPLLERSAGTAPSRASEARTWWPIEMKLDAVAPWDTLPGLFLSVTTFLGCGAAILLFLGTRGFCRFVCPYGAVFRVTDFAAPFRVRKVGPCAGGCMAGEAAASTPPCTAVCPTAIDVHAETARWGQVKSMDCVRCNLCIEACPQEALAHVTASIARVRLGASAVGLPDPGTRFRPVALISSAPEGVAAGRNGSRGEVTLVGEAFILLVAAAAYVVADGVYGAHFLAASIALGMGFLAWTILRAARGDSSVTLLRRPLRRGKEWTAVGITTLAALVLSAFFLFEAGAFKWLRREGLRLDAASSETSPASRPTQSTSTAREHLERAAVCYEAALEYFPSDLATRRLLLGAYLRLGDSRAFLEAENLCRRLPQGASESDTIRDAVRRRFPAARPPGTGR